MQNKNIVSLFQAARPKFLILTLASVFLGVSLVYSEGVLIHYKDLSLVLIGAIFAHISVNLFNEYLDFKSGLDFKTSKTPFSGGSGALIENQKASKIVLYFGIISLAVTTLIGLYLFYLHGFLLLIIGILGGVIILTYTGWINRKPLLCLIAPGLSFGPLMVVGTYFVLTDKFSFLAFIASLVPFFLVNNLLLINQLPDIKPDKSVGRLHFPIKHGVDNSLIVYGAFALAAFMVILLGVIIGTFPKLTLLTLIPTSLAILVWFGASKYVTIPDKLIPYLALNVIVCILTPLVFGVSLIVS